MSKGRLGEEQGHNSVYRQTNIEMEEHIVGTLRNLVGMCDIYDQGHPYIAFSLAAEIHKLLTTGKNIVLIRGDMMFPTIDLDYSPRNLTTEHKLVLAEQDGHSDQNPPFYVDFIPAYREASWPIKWISFRDWWNREVIYRASAAPVGTPVGLIPTDVRVQVPRNKRRTFCRRELIEQIRNKFGAHLDQEIPEELNSLQKSRAFGMDIRVEVDGRILSTMDGTMPMKTGPGAAMVRQIAQEVLEAFRRRSGELSSGDAITSPIG